jgi:hypothetical protein
MQVNVDSNQLAFLNSIPYPLVRSFQVRPKADGDIVEGLNFALMEGRLEEAPEKVHRLLASEYRIDIDKTIRTQSIQDITTAYKYDNTINNKDDIADKNRAKAGISNTNNYLKSIRNPSHESLMDTISFAGQLQSASKSYSKMKSNNPTLSTSSSQDTAITMDGELISDNMIPKIDKENLSEKMKDTSQTDEIVSSGTKSPSNEKFKADFQKKGDTCAHLSAKKKTFTHQSSETLMLGPRVE